MWLWPRQVLYIQLAPHSVSMRVPRTGGMFTEAADIAIRQRPSTQQRVIEAVGHAASLLRSSPDVQVYSPFAHPRSIINHVEEAEALLNQLIKQALGMRWLAVAPKVVIHPLGQPEGGFTQVELRALKELAKAAGAHTAHVWTGRALQDEEILSAPRPCPLGQWH